MVFENKYIPVGFLAGYLNHQQYQTRELRPGGASVEPGTLVGFKASDHMG